MHLQTVQLEGVMKARYESRVELMLISIHKWGIFIFFHYQWEEWNTSMEVKMCLTHGKEVIHQFDRFCNVCFVSIQYK